MVRPTFLGLALKSESSVVDLLVSYLGIGPEPGSFKGGLGAWVHKDGPGTCTVTEHSEEWGLQFLGND